MCPCRLISLPPARPAPLTRDGGQMLGRKFDLYSMTSDKSLNFR
ncbi:YjbH outer membrane lipoprotein [Cronobacter dublinensis 582]|nr:YjbH outer membrane lipoprotein [Cronobacter dublinensis 582]